MALQLNYYDANLEITVENCYYRIEKVETHKRLDGYYNVNVLVSIYKNKEKSIDGLLVNSRLYGFNELTSTELTLESLYGRLKTLDDFSGAIDC